MTILIALLIASIALTLILGALNILLLHRLRTESGAALRGLQLQIAFVAGRIGLRRQDLESQVPLMKEPEGITDAENFTEWNEADWMIAQAERDLVPEEATHES